MPYILSISNIRAIHGFDGRQYARKNASWAFQSSFYCVRCHYSYLWMRTQAPLYHVSAHYIERLCTIEKKPILTSFLCTSPYLVAQSTDLIAHSSNERYFHICFNYHFNNCVVTSFTIHRAVEFHRILRPCTTLHIGLMLRTLSIVPPCPISCYSALQQATRNISY